MEHLLQEIMEGKRPLFHGVSDTIWGMPETRYKEVRSSKVHRDTMAAQGFAITENLGNIPTAFLAQWSQGEGPVVAFLGEYDALPNLSQEADVTEHRPLEGNPPGHGCGHNLLGTAALYAAASLKAYMEKTGLGGTVRYYGCPAEESGAGKAFLVRAGVFEGVDACFSWHPFDFNCCSYSTLANVRVFYDFKGRSAHAAGAPEQGRSALEAVELMGVGVGFLREHLPQEARVHYAITNAGGDATNVIQADAQVLYAIRAPHMDQVRQMVERIRKIAEGAALMTETEVKIRLVSAYANVLKNPPLAALLEKHLAECLPLPLTAAEEQRAEDFARVLEPGAVEARRQKTRSLGGGSSAVQDVIEPEQALSISTDVGDVSWVVPTAALTVACFAQGTAAHTWQLTAQGKNGAALKGMDAAAYTLAAAALDVVQDPSLLIPAREAWEAAKAGQTYHTLIPDDVLPGSF